MKNSRSMIFPQVLSCTFSPVWMHNLPCSHCFPLAIANFFCFLKSVVLRSYVACSNKFIGQIYILCPKRPELRKCKVQPRLSSTIEMDHCSFLCIHYCGVLLIPKAQHVPVWINDMNIAMKCYQARRQCPQLPQTQV